MKGGRGDIGTHSHAPQLDVQAVITNARDHQRREDSVFDPRFPMHPTRTDYQLAQSAWGDTVTTPPPARPQKLGMGRKLARGHQVEGSSTNEVQPYVRTGNNQIVALTRPDNTSMSAQDVVPRSTEQTLVPLPNPEIRTPLVAEEWRAALEAAHITHKYPKIPEFIQTGADTSIHSLQSTFTPPNHLSILLYHTAFNNIVNSEFHKGRYWGPHSKEELETILGPFQTSPLSLIPKLGRHWGQTPIYLAGTLRVF